MCWLPILYSARKKVLDPLPYKYKIVISHGDVITDYTWRPLTYNKLASICIVQTLNYT